LNVGEQKSGSPHTVESSQGHRDEQQWTLIEDRKNQIKDWGDISRMARYTWV